MQIPGYNQMLKYLESNQLELYNELKNYYENNKTARGLVDSKNQMLNIKNGEMLINIVLEYRVPIETVCEFVNQNKDIFLKDVSKVLGEEEMVEVLKSLSVVDLQEAVKWYFYESLTPDEYTEYRITTFYDFAKQFATLKSNFKILTDFINIKTHLPIESIISRNSLRKYREKYNYSIADIRAIIKYAYKYALSTRGMPGAFLMDSFDYRNHLPILKESNELEDQMLVKGYEKLLDYKKDVSFDRNIVARLNG